MESLRNRLAADTKMFPADMMEQDGAWVKKFGPVPGVRLFQKWKTRKACSEAKVHVPQFAGISATKQGGISICVSDSYENEDHGDRIIYIGTGGREDPFSNSTHHGITSDQSFEHRMNFNLRKSLQNNLPVRVVRGPNPNSKYAPAEGYRYDGLYMLKSAEYGKSRDDLYRVCRFEFERIPGQAPIPIRRT